MPAHTHENRSAPPAGELDAHGAAPADEAAPRPLGGAPVRGVPRLIGTLQLIVLAALAGTFLYVVPLSVRPLASPDEVRYGEIAREMLVTGDWVSPHFNGVRYFEKPVLGHWINAASLGAFGTNPLALRAPVALATVLTALIVFLLARRFAGTGVAGAAALIFLTTTLVGSVGTFAVLDPFLTLFVTAALAAYYLAIETPQQTRRLAYLALCGAMCAAAFLTKGFIAIAVPALVAAGYLVARRRWRVLLSSSWLPIVIAAALVLPWALAIQAREPDFWRYFFWVEHVQRFAGEHAQHAQPFWFYLACLPLVGWPWIFFLPAALAGLARAPRRNGFTTYMVLWALLPFLFFSLSKGKLLTYILPCFAPLSVVLAIGLDCYWSRAARRSAQIAAALAAAILLGALATVLAAQAGVFGPAPFGQDEAGKLLLLVIALGAGAACGVYACLGAGGRRVRWLAAIAGTGIAVLLPLQYAVPQRLLERVAPGAVVAAYASVDPDTVVVSDAPLFGTVAWYLQRDDIYVLSAGEIAYGLDYEESRGRLLDPAALRRLAASASSAQGLLVIGSPETAARIETALPAAAQRLESGDVVVWRVAPARPDGRPVAGLAE